MVQVAPDSADTGVWVVTSRHSTDIGSLPSQTFKPYWNLHKSPHIMKKPVFWCLRQLVSLNLAIGIILSKQRTTKVLIRLRRCAGWSAPLLFTYGMNRFSHDVACFSFIFLFDHPQVELRLSHMWLELVSNPQWWDEQRFRALKISVLNHSATGAVACIRKLIFKFQ